jgi:hypothetical protein
MDEIASNDRLKGKRLRIKSDVLYEAVYPKFLLFRGRTDGIHSMAYLKQQRERI